MRCGLTKRLEFRTYWLGQTWIETKSRPGGPWRAGGGINDMEVGFKWQLLPGDKERKWIPTTALITSIIAPTGGTSPLSGETVEQYINLIYGWNVTDKLTILGSTGDLGTRLRGTTTRARSDNYQRWHQSLVAFYAVGDRTTLFYEWYIWMFTSSINHSPQNYMDWGVLYHPTPNTQLDLRAGFNVSAQPGDFFTGAGFSVRF
jgi:hypothetical protein